MSNKITDIDVQKSDKTNIHITVDELHDIIHKSIDRTLAEHNFSEIKTFKQMALETGSWFAYGLIAGIVISGLIVCSCMGWKFF